jgi:glycosyltransferase involved in cell wall biosynthesis
MTICYCHTPMRHIWDLYRTYLGDAPGWKRPFFAWAAKGLREWDYQAAQQVTHFLANSCYIQQRIGKYYRRHSTVIYPPVDTNRGVLSPHHDDYYLSVSRLNRTKRVDILIRACNRLGRRLIVSGWGPEEHALTSIAGPTIEFVGRVPDERLSALYSCCRALLFAADDDFGLVPVEAQSYGRPVIAYGRGGSLETIRVGSKTGSPDTGVFFLAQTPEAVVDGIRRFEEREDSFNPEEIRAHAQQFSQETFVQQFSAFVESALDNPGAPQCR